MGDTARYVKARLDYWKPVLLRGALWVGIAMATDFRHSMGEVSKRIGEGKLPSWTDWTDITTGAVLAGMIALRLFLDQTLSRHVEGPPNGGSVNPPAVPLG